MKTRGLSGIREDLILYAAAELLGHVDISSLRYYVSLALKTLTAEANGTRVPTSGLTIDTELLEDVRRQNSL